MGATETKTESGTTGGGAGHMNRQLDWVAVRGREHAEEVFRRLHEVVQRDVESARKHARADQGKFLGFDQIEFHCSDVERWYFGVNVMPAGPRSPQLCVRMGFELESGHADSRPRGLRGERCSACGAPGPVRAAALPARRRGARAPDAALAVQQAGAGAAVLPGLNRADLTWHGFLP